ncbi:MAG: FprA family A-type flavoprotein [Nitrososphaerota archaeon]
MNWRNIVELDKNVYWVGVRDWNRRIFDALIPLPKGTTYNAYLIIGKDKKALIDTVNPGFEIELEEKIKQIIDPKDLDYVIMNHAEPDHAGSIPHIMNLSDKAKLIVTKRGAKMAQIFYKVPEERIVIVTDGNTIDLGDKTLKFIEAPMLHWPETMFTYLQESGILFPCDFFGSHTAEALYDEEVDNIISKAQKYFGEIMMPFRNMVKNGLEKIKNLKINIIAPSHGPIYKNPERIINAYYKWANGETKNKAVIIYVTMWGSTESIVKLIIETLASEGIEVALHNLIIADIGEIAKDLVDSRAIILGAPTVLGGAHPLAVYAAYLIRVLQPSAKFCAIFSSYGWGGGAIRHLKEIISPLKIEIIDTLEINGSPSKDDEMKIIELSKKIAEKIKI